MSEREAKTILGNICYFCNTTPSVNNQQQSRNITVSNYKLLGINDENLIEAKTYIVCQECWISKTVRNYRRKCAVPNCTTSRRKLTKTYFPPVDSLSAEKKKVLLQNLNIMENDKICQKCYHKILAGRKSLQEDLQEEGSNVEDESENTGITVVSSQTSAKMGRPRVSYDNASAAVKRKMRASAKNVVKEMIEKCDEISQDDGRKLLDDVMKKTPLRDMQEEKRKPHKWNAMIEDLSQTYGKENHGAHRRIRLLSTIANHFSNKELKKAFPCTDYEITEARRHASFIGAGATPPNVPRVTRYRIPVEDLAFVVNFLHSPDNATRSSHRIASSEGKKSSWLSNLSKKKPTSHVAQGQ